MKGEEWTKGVRKAGKILEIGKGGIQLILKKIIK